MVGRLISSLRSKLIVLILIAALPGVLVTILVASRQRIADGQAVTPESISAALRLDLLSLGVLLALALATAWILASKTLLRPISRISDTTRQFGAGKLDARTGLEYADGELGRLARDIDEMGRELEQRRAELNQLNGDLELRVQQRTSQLEKVVDQLHTSREQLRRLSVKQRSALEDEQTRLSREVHDQIGQALTGFKMDLSTLERRLSGAEAPDVIDKIQAMNDQIDKTIVTTRAIALRLRPTILDDLGLDAALGWLAQDFENRTGIACTVINHSALGRLDRDTSTAAYRIVQEALTNVFRHAQATEALVELAREGEMLNVQVSDNGVGLASGHFENTQSLGVLGMRERAQELDGKLTIEAAERGVLVTVLLPTTPARADRAMVRDGHP